MGQEIPFFFYPGFFRREKMGDGVLGFTVMVVVSDHFSRWWW